MFKQGSILSEIQFYVVKETTKNEIVVVDDNNNSITIPVEYAEKILNSADNFNKEEKITATALAEKFLSSTRIAMTVAYRKKDEKKTKKKLLEERNNALEKITKETNETQKLLLIKELIDNPILDFIPGEFRVMKGRHYGHLNDLGRVDFIDMEQQKNDNAVDSRNRQVDPRTLQYIIVNGVKYSLK